MEFIRIYIKELYRDLLSTYDIEHDERINALMNWGKWGMLGAELSKNLCPASGKIDIARLQLIDPSKIVFIITNINLTDMYIEGVIPESKRHEVLMHIPHMVAVPRVIKNHDGSLNRLITFDLKYVDSKDIDQLVMEIPIPLDLKNLIEKYDFAGDKCLQHNLMCDDLFADLFPIVVKNSVQNGGNTIDHCYYDRQPYLSLSVATITKINPMYMTITIKPNHVWNGILERNIDRLVALPRFSVHINEPYEFNTKGFVTSSMVTFDIDIRDIYPAPGIDIKSKPKILKGGNS